MRRVWMALREWLQLRARLREEYRFHLERSAADLRSLGLSRREAKQAARHRFGARKNLRIARHEIGGDCAGLARLFRDHRIMASAWLQPSLLVACIGLAIVASPGRRVLLESVLDRPLSSASRQTVFLLAPAPWPLFTGITTAEFETLRSLSTLTAVERYQSIYVRGIARSASLSTVEAEARSRTGNPRILAESRFEQTRIGMQPAIAIWIIVMILVVSFLCTHAPRLGKGRWLLYGLFLVWLHLLASLTAWALAVQIWSQISWPTPLSSSLSLALFLVAWILASAAQYYCWRFDLSQRCPVCLERLLLASTEGATDRVLLSVAVTESVCAHGHGVFVETRWARQFRHQSSPLEALIHG